MNPQMKNKLLISILLIAVVFAVYYQTIQFDFINLDDNGYVYENNFVRGGLHLLNIGWAFTSMLMSNWHPLTWLSYMVDSQLFGLNPGGFHFTNVLFHAVNAVLLFILLCRLTGSIMKSGFVAALLALHPLHVESVAWVSERKDLLSAFFFFITLYLYSRYTASRKPLTYVLCIMTFALGLMAKPMLVTLPLILLLLDFWPCSRFRRAGGQTKGSSSFRDAWRDNSAHIIEKLPFFALSAISSVITIYAQQKGGAVANLDSVPMLPRFENAFVSYVMYLFKAIWPAHLAAVYPLREIPVWEGLGALILIMGITFIACGKASRYPYLFVGWFWYLVSLAPVIGVVQVGNQAMADHYSYLPLTGIFVMIAWGTEAVPADWKLRKPGLLIASIAIIICLGTMAWQQASYWKDSETVFSHTLQVAPENNFMAQNLLGRALLDKGRIDEAMKHFNQGLEMKPQSTEILYNIALARSREGKDQEALGPLLQALRIEPANALTNYNLGTTLLRLGKTGEAIRYLTEAIRLRPEIYEAHYNLGVVFANQGKVGEAVAQLSEALRYAPYSGQTNYLLGLMLEKEGKPWEAEKYFGEAVRLNPGDANAEQAWERVKRLH